MNILTKIIYDKNEMRKVVCFHLYNNYSGSPKVLSFVISGLLKKGYQIDLYTSQTDGFLSNLEGVKCYGFNYKWTNNKCMTFLRLLNVQLYIFFASMKYRKEKEVLFYINTICPVGAVLSAALLKVPVIYHVHEKYVRPNLLHRFYELIWKKFSKTTFFVSKYLLNQYESDCKQSVVVYNALSHDFLSKVVIKSTKNIPSTILMISSLKLYKGVNEFVSLAERLPQYNFILVVNGSSDDVCSFFKKNPVNLQIYSAQKTIYDFLYKADLVLNLSIPSLWVETFGLTLLEAMSFGLPVICPPVGGPTELVENDYNGFLVDSRQINELIDKVVYILESGQYERFASNAKTKSLLFNYDNMINIIDEQIKIS